MKALLLALVTALAVELAGCTLVQKAVTGAAAGGVGGFLVAGPPGAAIGADAGAVAAPIVF
jgi:hypothetical protein